MFAHIRIISIGIRTIVASAILLPSLLLDISPCGIVGTADARLTLHLTNILKSITTKHTAKQVLKRAHSHNDYHQQYPLSSALSHGLKSIEVDVFPRNDKLLVAHTVFELDAKKTIENMYLQPLLLLLKRSRAQKAGTRQREKGLFTSNDDQDTKQNPPQRNRTGRKFAPLMNPNDDSITLLVDLKADPDKSITLLHSALAPLRPYLSHVDAHGTFHSGRITVLISGNRPSEESLHAPFSQMQIRGGSSRDTIIRQLRSSKRKYRERYMFIDGRTGDIRGNSNTKLVPLISIPWRAMQFARWTGRGEVFMKHMVREAHLQGKRLRIWGAPNAEKAWTQMMNSNVDYLSIDEHKAFSKFASTYGKMDR